MGRRTKWREIKRKILIKESRNREDLGGEREGNRGG